MPDLAQTLEAYADRLRSGRARSRPLSPHLKALEAESIHIMREVAAEFERPVMLYSIGKDSAVMLHLAMKAFFPSRPPFPLQHVDTGWKFREMIAFRDALADALGIEMRVHKNPEGVARGISPFEHGSSLHTQVMKTEALRQAMDAHRYDAAFGGARRDEEKSRAKERVFSFRDADHGWDPRNQRPELWRTFNTKIRRARHLAVHPRRGHPHRPALFRQAQAGHRGGRPAPDGR
jgi:sulfate adenylyltransferase subunit 2